MGKIFRTKTDMIEDRATGTKLSDKLSGLDTSLAQITQQIINVKSAPYNAKGDGTTDDTNAILSAVSAVNALSGGILYFPLGTYLINQPILISQHGVKIKGQSASWDDSHASTIKAGSTFSGSYIVGFQNSSGYIRSVGMEDITIDGGSNSSAHGMLGHRVYDFGFFKNIMIQNIADAYNCFRFEPDSVTSPGQTVTAINLTGTHRTNNATAPTFWVETLQESVFINCKAWAGQNSSAQGTADCWRIKSCAGVTLYDCTAAFSSGNGFYVEKGEVGRGNSIRIVNPTLEGVSTPFNSKSTSYKLTGTINTVPAVGSTVQQGSTTGIVTFATSTGIYVKDSTGTWATGSITDTNSNSLGTISTITKDELYNIEFRGPRFDGSTTPLVINMTDLTSPKIDITQPYTSGVTVSATVDATTTNANVNISFPMSVTDNGVNTQVNYSGYPLQIRTSQIVTASGTLPNAYKGMRVKVIHDKDQAEYGIYTATGDTIDGQTKFYVVGNAATSSTVINLVALADHQWTVESFVGRYYLYSGSANLPYNINHTRQLTLSSNASVGAQHTGYVITNNGATGSVNYTLTSTPNMVGSKIMFVKEANQTLTITPNASDTIRGASAAGKYLSLTNVGDSVTLLNVVSGYWEIVHATGSYTFQP